MKKIFTSVALFGLLSTAASAFDGVPFTDTLLDNAELKALPKAELLEAPTHIQSSIDNETYIESSNSIEPAVASKEYAGARVWGKLCNIVHTPNGQYKWSINRYDLATDSVETIFGVSNNRKIQSVACDPSGYDVVFSMKETQGGDYEIYTLSPYEEEYPLFKLTDNDTDDVDVTSNWNGSVIAWQNRLADGRQAILLTRFDFENYTNPPIVKSLASASPFVQPSLSANGKWLTFVQLRPSFFAVMRYDIENNKYLEIRKIPRRKRLFHPSISNDGTIIGWAENRKQNRYMVKDLSANTLTQVLNNSNGIEHASVSANGDLLAYSVNADAKRQTYMTNLDTLATTRVGDILYGTNRYLGTSWLGASLQDLQLEQVNGQVFVDPDGPFLLAFSRDGSGAEFSNGDGEFSDYLGQYTEDFNWMVTDGKLFVDYDIEASGSVDVSLVNVEGNKYTIVGEDSDGESGIGELYNALPLSLSDLEGKVISLDMSGSEVCTAMTFAFTSTNVHQVELCPDREGGIANNSYSPAASNNFDHVIVMEDNSADGKDASMMLIDGSITEGAGTVAFVLKESDGTFDFLAIHDFTVVDEEASLPSLESLIGGETLYFYDTKNAQNDISSVDL